MEELNNAKSLSLKNTNKIYVVVVRHSKEKWCKVYKELMGDINHIKYLFFALKNIINNFMSLNLKS